MNNAQVIIALVAVLVSVVCALPGTFLVLRGVALMSDAISHAVLLGIALFFLLTKNLDSPLLLVGAALAGMATVLVTEFVISTRRLKQDAAIGIVFPLFFSCGVILISLFARNVHLDVDMVILGEIIFAPFNRLIIAGVDYGPYAVWALSGILLLNVLFVALFYKELKLSIFDYDYAYLAGASPATLYYALMMLTSITAVGTFDIVGSIVVVALMITPPATAYLLTRRLEVLLGLSIGFAIVTSLAGYYAAYIFDVSIAGSIATVGGMLFVGVVVVAPDRGLLANFLYRRKTNVRMSTQILHSYLQNAPKNVSLETIQQDLGWSLAYTRKIYAALQFEGR